MSVNRGSVPLLRQVQAEAKGKSLVPSMKSQIRLALLAGERLSNREVPGRFGVSITALNDAVRDLQRFGYKFDRTESADTGAVHWVTNPKHYPRTDLGPVRKRPPRKRSGKVEPVVELEPVSLGQTFLVVRTELDEDGGVTYVLRRDDGRELVVTEEEG